jgi:transposase InsO family protein
MAAHDVVCSPERVRRIMRQRGLRAIQPKNFIPKTSDGKASRPSPNLLASEPPPTKPNQVWTADFTFIPSASGWLYLALVMDLYSRRIVGWKLASHMRGELVIQAFEQALGSRPRTSDTVFHSDRGSQYASSAFRSALRAAKFRQSMSARSNPYDNAWTESVIGTIKREMLQNGSFDTQQDAQTEIFEYIEGYYNTSRRHSALGYCSPAQFESHYFTNN